MRQGFALALFTLLVAGCPSSTTPGTDTGVMLDSGGATDAPTGVDAPTLDSAAALDAPAGDAGDLGGVDCFGTSGDCAAGEVCCYTPAETTCEASAAACAGGTTVACDGTEDCGAELCCADGSAGTACAASCTGFHICHSAAECGTGESCCPNGGGIPLGGLMHCTTLPPGTSCPLPP